MGYLTVNLKKTLLGIAQIRYFHYRLDKLLKNAHSVVAVNLQLVTGVIAKLDSVS